VSASETKTLAAQHDFPSRRFALMERGLSGLRGADDENGVAASFAEWLA
jgi:hypothetical protein